MWRGKLDNTRGGSVVELVPAASGGSSNVKPENEMSGSGREVLE